MSFSIKSFGIINSNTFLLTYLKLLGVNWDKNLVSDIVWVKNMYDVRC